MHSSRPLFVLGLLVSLLSLDGCTISFVQGESSSSRKSVSETSVVAEKSLSLRLAKNTMTYGGELTTACGPEIHYFNGLTTSTLSLADPALTVRVSQGEKTYTPGDLLPVGEYTLNVDYAYAKLSASATFSVIEGNPVAGSEGHGYKTRSSLGDYTLKNYPRFAALGNNPITSNGNAKILVIPVSFKDNDPYTSAELQTLENAYNGATSSTGWESLHSFYANSSYNKLNLSATIATPYVSTQTDVEFENSAIEAGDGYASVATTLAETALLSLQSSLNLSDFDSDNDGSIDGVQLLYKTTRNNLKKGGAKIWWNFTTVDGRSPQATSPRLGYYFWSEFSALTNGYYTPNIDTHVLIHETGHMLGLTDYYSYDRDECPAGAADMMDHNIGDHNAFSKMLLGWINPKIIDGSATDFTLTLSPFEENGETVLLRNTSTDPFNGTPFDEYLLLQYYTPTGLNEKDAAGYPEWNGRGMYSTRGLQVFHIDSRLFGTDGTSYAYTDSITTSIGVAASNTGSSSFDVEKSHPGSQIYHSPYRLIEAIPATGVDSLGSSESGKTMGTSAYLFSSSAYQGGSPFYSNYGMRSLFPNGLAFNDGTSLDYSFCVEAQTDDAITLHFVKNG
jgi:M6 family metalloprotease-like protein